MNLALWLDRAAWALPQARAVADGDAAVADYARLRRRSAGLVYGGAPMLVEDTVAALDRLGPCLAQLYGQGESPMTITAVSKGDLADRAHPRWRQRLAAAGGPRARRSSCASPARTGWSADPARRARCSCAEAP